MASAPAVEAVGEIVVGYNQEPASMGALIVAAQPAHLSPSIGL